MNKQTLTGYGLSEEQAAKVIADLSGAYVPKSRFDEVNTEKNQLKDKVSKRDEQLLALQKAASDYEDLQAELKALTKTNKKQSEANAKAMNTLRKEAAIKLGLAGKAHDPSDILALIDLEKVELDGTGGLKTEVDTLTKSIRESKPYLFKEKARPVEPKLEGIVKLETSSPALEEVPRQKNVPYKLSFSSYPSTTQAADVGAVAQEVKLFLDKGIEGKTNAKIVVHRDGKKFVYKNSGEPAIFSFCLATQEINLELFSGRCSYDKRHCRGYRQCNCSKIPRDPYLL